MAIDPDIVIGNSQDLEDFKEHFRPNDRRTLDGYYRIAKKKGSLMVVRRPDLRAVQMQVLVVPYEIGKTTKGLREVLKGRVWRFTGFIQAIPIATKQLFVFGEMLPKHEGPQFKEANPKTNKRARKASKTKKENCDGATIEGDGQVVQ